MDLGDAWRIFFFAMTATPKHSWKQRGKWAWLENGPSMQHRRPQNIKQTWTYRMLKNYEIMTSLWTWMMNLCDSVVKIRNRNWGDQTGSIYGHLVICEAAKAIIAKRGTFWYSAWGKMWIVTRKSAWHVNGMCSRLWRTVVGQGDSLDPIRIPSANESMQHHPRAI